MKTPTECYTTFRNPKKVQVPFFAADILFGKYGATPKTGTARKRLYLLLWVCHHLKKQGASEEDGAVLNARFAECLFGKKKPVIPELLELKIIEKSKPAHPSVSCARYRFTDPSPKNRKVTLKDATVIEWKGSKERYARARLRGAGYPAALLDNFRRFTPGPSFSPAMDTLIGLSQSKASKDFTRKRDQILAGYWQFSVKHYRITNHIVDLPEQVRRTFVVDGEPVIELDFANSHPCFLPSIFTPKPNATPEEIDDHERLIELVRNGKFYELTQDCWEEDKEVFKDYIRKPRTEEPDEDGMFPSVKEFLTKEPRKGIKVCWQVIFNCKSTPKRLFKRATWNKFSESFPTTAARLASYKRKNPRALGDELRRREAQMIGEILSEFKDPASKILHPCVSLYDGLLCSESLAGELMDVCRKVTPNHLGFVCLPA